MLHIGYSGVYSTSKGQFRYNYTTRQLERLENKICLQRIDNRETPMVQSRVTDKINLKPDKFDLCPEYWVELYESVLERTIRK